MCKLLKMTICSLIPLFIVFSVLSANSQEEQDIGSLLPRISISEQGKNLLNMNLSLKANLLMFLHYDSCGNSKARDYKGMYALFSKKYLTAFSNIQSAEEYEKRMLDSSEIYHTVYLLIKHVEFIKK
ncbi:MAG: hypothetical protein JXB42_13665 [Deltaproteobacteria bacterium]|nr:hypothetical protein [Deltaproteobacteria bacterium]